MSTEITTKPAYKLSADSLSTLGFKSVSGKSAAATIKASGGYVPDGASNELLNIAAAVVKTSSAAAKAGRQVALALAMIERSGEYLSLKDANGKYFKSASALFSSMFPSLASSTIRNYLNAGRIVYLPYELGEIPAELKPIAELEPASVMFASSIMAKDDAKPLLAAAVSDITKDGTKLTQSRLKDAVKAVKSKLDSPSTDSTTPTSESDAKAAFDTDVANMRVLIKKLFAPDFADGEYHFTIYEQYMGEAFDTIKDSTTDPTKALVFVSAFYKAINGK